MRRCQIKKRAILIAAVLGLLSFAEANDRQRSTQTPLSSKPSSVEIKKGRVQFARNRCNTCHTVEGIGGCLAPPLDGISDRRSREFLLSRITKGTKHESDFAKRYGEELMPHLRIPAEDARVVVEYLLTIPKPQKGFKVIGHDGGRPESTSSTSAATANADSIRSGRLLLSSKGCLACHSVGNLGGSFAPKLDGIGNRRSVGFIKAQMKNAELLTIDEDQEYGPRGTTMPPLNLTDQNISDLANYLTTLK